MSKTLATVYLVLGRVLNLGLQFVAIRLLLTWLGDARYGQYVFIQSLAAYLIIFDTGLWIGIQRRLTEAISKRDGAEADRIVRLQFLSGWAIGLASMLGFLTLGFWLSRAPHKPEVIPPSMLMVAFAAAACLSSNYAASCQYVLQSQERFGAIAKLNLILSFSGTLMALLLTWRYKSVEATVLGMTLGSWVAAIAGNFMVRPSRAPIRGHARRLLKDTVPIGIRSYPHRLSSLVGRIADRTIIGFLNSGQLGMYSVACRVPEVLSEVANPMVTTTLPEIVRAQHDPKELSRLIVRNSLISVAIGCSFVFMPTAFAHSILRIWLPKHATDIEVVVLCMGLYRTFELVYSAISVPFYASGQVQRLIPFSAYNALATALGTYFAFTQWGLIGVALMNVGIGVSAFLPVCMALRRLVGPPFNMVSFASRVLLVIGLTAVAACGIHWGIDVALLTGREFLALFIAPLWCALWMVGLCASKLCPVPDPILRRLPRRGAWRTQRGAEIELDEPVETLPEDMGKQATGAREVGRRDAE